MSEGGFKIGGTTVGAGNLVLIAGPCAIESRDRALATASFLAALGKRLGVQVVFKASFDKANRLRRDSFRGPGLEEGLRVIEEVRRDAGLPVLTDVHEPGQAAAAAQGVDMLQIPAFLCRQTDLLAAAGATGLPVNVKKGQFMSPSDMKYSAEKALAAGAAGVMLTERGTFFGYADLVVDMRSIVVMRGLGFPVAFDATHSLQRPGSEGGATGGDKCYCLPLACAAAAAGIDAIYVETSPAPERALSDSATTLGFDALSRLFEKVLKVHNLTREVY